MTTTSAPSRSTCARTSSAAPPIATISWSKSHSRATPTTWPSSVPSRNGSVCFGRPSRFEPPAPSTRPQTNGSVGGGMLQLEGRFAALAAEVDRLALVLERRRARHDGHGHPADRVDGGRRRVARRAAHRDDLRQDRERDLLRRARADVEPGGRVDARRSAPAHAVAAQLAEHALAAAAARHQPDVGQRPPRGRARSAGSSSRPWPATTSARSSGRGSNSPPTTPTMSSPSSPPSRSSACEIGMSPSTSTRGAGTTGSTNTSIIPPDRHGFCTVTTPRSSSPPNGTTRSSTTRRSRSRAARTRARSARRSRRRRSPRSSRPRARARCCRASRSSGAATRTTVAVANGTPCSASSCARRVRAGGIIAAARAGPASPPTRGRGCTACRGARRRATRTARRSPR